jgi:hypothetical protein
MRILSSRPAGVLRRVALMLAITALASSVWAQSGPTGALNGRVVDQSRAAVPGVTVTATHTATNSVRTGVTNGEGLYTLPALPTGTYELTFSLDGFRPVRRQGVLVEAAVPRTIDVTLEVGGLSEQVTVQAESPVLQRTTPTVTRRLSSEELESIPSSTSFLDAQLHASADSDRRRQCGHPARRQQ